jgi:hypothetical protein
MTDTSKKKGKLLTRAEAMVKAAKGDPMLMSAINAVVIEDALKRLTHTVKTHGLGFIPYPDDIDDDERAVPYARDDDEDERQQEEEQEGEE